MLLRKLFGSMRAAPRESPAPPVDYPLEIEQRLTALHSKAPVRAHLEILHGDLRIGDESFVDVYFRCLEATGTVVTPFNVFQRFQTRHDLVRYFVATAGVPGARIECGAYRGATALLLCHVWRARVPSFAGEGYYLLDSFSGTPASTPEDFIPVQGRAGIEMQPFFPPGKTDVTAEAVRGYFSDFPRARVIQGWIPGVLETLPQTAWAFVHLDLTLYEPTLAALNYFYERLSPGGVIVCDGSIFCPGAQRAVEAFADRHGVAYVTLGHRESVFLKAATPHA